jgi:hypothetical protein
MLFDEAASESSPKIARHEKFFSCPPLLAFTGVAGRCRGENAPEKIKAT